MNVQDVLNDKIAQELLTSTELARLAYTWRDGSPRVVPIWFHWNGSEVVMASPVEAPKVAVLESRPQVAISIDSAGSWPYHALMLRGNAKVERQDGVPGEYVAAGERYAGHDVTQAWVAHLEKMGFSFARIRVAPTYARILDFATRFPSATTDAFKSFVPAG
jgi:Pyridoxamine 5'-phosphate oxidase